MNKLPISKRTSVTLGVLMAIMSAVGTSGYFVGTAHSKINDIERRIKTGEIRTGDNMDILLNIERRLSRIEGRLQTIHNKISQ